MRGSDEKLRPFHKSANRTENISLISFATCGSRETFVHKTERRTLPKKSNKNAKRCDFIYDRSVDFFGLGLSIVQAPAQRYNGSIRSHPLNAIKLRTE